MKNVTRGLVCLIIVIAVMGLALFAATKSFSLFWPNLIQVTESASPKIYKLQFGVTVSKFMILNDRLHLLVPLPVTGESGNIIEIYKTEKKARKGK